MADAKVDELNQDDFIFDVINVVNGLCDIYLFSHAMSIFSCLMYIYFEKNLPDSKMF